MINLIKMIWHLRTKSFGIHNRICNAILLRLFKVKCNGKIAINGRLYLYNAGTCVIGNDVKLNSQPGALPYARNACISLQIGKGAHLTIGDNVGITASAINCSHKITVEKNVFIGEGCVIIDTDFHSVSLNNRLLEQRGVYQDIKVSPVTLRNGCFIGARTIILKGVEIGEKSIIGAGSVVSKSIPAKQIWGGNPAHYIRDLRQHELD